MLHNYKLVRFVLLLNGILFCHFLFAQPTIYWNFSAQKIDSNIYKVLVKASIPQGWYLYAGNNTTVNLPAPEFVYSYENIQPVHLNEISKATNIHDAIFDNKEAKVFIKEIALEQTIRIKGTEPPSLKGTLTVYAAKENEFYPLEIPFEINIGAQTVQKAEPSIPMVASKKPITTCGNTTTSPQSNNMLSVFFLGLLGGIIALFTPCVFPMIPVTVSFFTKKSPSKKAAFVNAFFYGFFIFLIYLVISLPFHIAGSVNPQIFNTIATNAWLNLIFFIIFLVFAFSFFGFFNINLPGFVANKADSKSGLESIGGIFFMSLTLSIVSFSCTGPILGSLLVGSLNGGAWQLTAGLAGFGLALALPFTLFALFPNWLHSLPKSGGWLDVVKKVLAFVELALAFKFLSNADMVMHWGILKREVFVGLWFIIALLLAAYLFGWLHLPHDEKKKPVSLARKLIGSIAVLFALYLLGGLLQPQQVHLKLLSGFPPPVSYSLQSSSYKKIPHVINNYEEALALSKQQHKPLLLDFTGWACVNCRKMEENVWTHPEVYEYINEHFILVSLYVDDRKKLPIEKRFTYKTSSGSEKNIETIGDLWAQFEIENFQQASQPLYVILNANQQLINEPIGYTPDAKQYLAWLECGYKNF